MMNNGLQNHMGRVESCVDNNKCAANDTRTIRPF